MICPEMHLSTIPIQGVLADPGGVTNSQSQPITAIRPGEHSKDILIGKVPKSESQIISLILLDFSQIISPNFRLRRGQVMGAIHGGMVGKMSPQTWLKRGKNV